MRIMPFMKRKKGIQFAGVGLDTGGGGGGSYVLPPATANTLGGVKIGDGLEVEEDGTLSTSGGGGGGFDFSASEVLVGTYFNQNLYKKSYQIASDITCASNSWTNIITDSALSNAEIITAEPLKVKSAYSGTSQIASNCMVRLSGSTVSVLAVGIEIPLLANSVVTIYYTKTN